MAFGVCWSLMFLQAQTELVSLFSDPKSHICPTVQQRGPKVPRLHLLPYMNSVHSTAASEKRGQWELHINYIRNYKGQHTLLVSTAATFPHLNSIYSSRPQTALPARTLLWRLHRRTGCAQVPLFTSNPTKWDLFPTRCFGCNQPMREMLSDLGASQACRHATAIYCIPCK